MPSRSADTRALGAAALTSAALVAFDTAGRATRDALFLASYGAHALPAMVVAGSSVALVTGVLASRMLGRRAPIPFLVGMLVLSAVGLLVEWSAAGRAERVVAVAVYLHFTALSGLCIAGFWTAISERFDPRSARRAVGRIAAAGTVGGLVGGVVAERIAVAGAVSSMLLVLAALSLVAAAIAPQLRPEHRPPTTAETPAAVPGGRTRLRDLASSPYVRVLLAIVVLGAVAETLLDFVFMTRASAAYPGAAALLRVFAIFYTGAAAVTVLVQLGLSRRVIDAIGLAPAATILPGGVALTGISAAIWPGLASAVIARGSELVLRNSVFRSAYELLFNALRPREKRAAKTLVDVTATRGGRILGSGIVQLAIILAPGVVLPVVVLATVAVALAGVAVLPVLRRRYRSALADHVVDRVPTADEAWAADTDLFPVVVADGAFITGTFPIATAADPATGPATGPTADQRLLELRSGDVARVRAALAAPLPVALTDEVVRLLQWAPVIPDATRALDGAGAIAVPALRRALLDGTAPFAVRRRVALLLGTIPVREARDALVAGLGDPRFEVRYRCGRALARLASADRALAPPAEQVFALVANEVDVSRRVWDGRQLVALLPDEGPRELLGVALQERTDRALEHVFRLLALCLPSEPVLAAFRGLQSDDLHVRGTALDYLESVVPAEIRSRLWRVLEGGPAGGRVVGVGGAGADAAAAGVAQLLRDQESLAIRVEELRRRRADD